MPTSVTTQLSPYVDKLIVDTTANATLEANVLSGGATCYIFDVDNSNNTVPCYLKIWNATGPTVGTTESDIVLLVPKQVRQTVSVTDGIYLGTALSFVCVTLPATNSTASPTNDVTVRIMAE